MEIAILLWVCELNPLHWEQLFMTDIVRSDRTRCVTSIIAFHTLHSWCILIYIHLVERVYCLIHLFFMFFHGLGSSRGHSMKYSLSYHILYFLALFSAHISHFPHLHVTEIDFQHFLHSLHKSHICPTFRPWTQHWHAQLCYITGHRTPLCVHSPHYTFTTPVLTLWILLSNDWNSPYSTFDPNLLIGAWVAHDENFSTLLRWSLQFRPIHSGWNAINNQFSVPIHQTCDTVTSITAKYSDKKLSYLTKYM